MLRWISLSTLGLALIFFFLLQNPNQKEKLLHFFQKNDTQVLAIAYGTLTGDHRKQKVVKILSQNKIYLEIYDATESPSSPNRLQKILLPDSLDTQVDFRGNLTRLIIADINQDGQVDIVAPTMDGQMVPHLNAYAYDKNLESFEPVPQAQQKP